jgi:hypothetical protein
MTRLHDLIMETCWVGEAAASITSQVKQTMM